MKQRLTLNIDARVIQKAKLFARKNNTTLSNLVETFLVSLNSENESVVSWFIENAPVKKLSRVMRKKLRWNI